MKLFSEKVNTTLTNAPFNILSVKDFSEVFFDVYQVAINESQYTVEKISEHNGDPIVSVPVELRGKQGFYPFVLVKGEPEILFNEKNVLFDRSEQEIIEESVEVEEEEEISFPEVFERRDEILLQIEQAKRDAKVSAERIKKRKIEETDKELAAKKRVLVEMVKDARASLVEEFISVSGKVRDELVTENIEHFDSIRESLDNKILKLSKTLQKSLENDFEGTSLKFDNKVKELIKEIHESLQPSIDKELKGIAKDVVTKVGEISKSLDTKLTKKADISLVEGVKGDVSKVIEGNIELNDKIEKSVNRALSRVGKVDKRIDEFSESIDNKIKTAENNITEYYEKKLQLLEDKTFDITEEARKYFMGLIRESKDSLVAEVRAMKKEAPIEYIIEAKGDKKNINGDDLIKDLDTKISTKIDTEITRMRKYVAVYGGGGGTVAMQFADGGTMNGNLNINGNLLIVGTLSASQYLGIPNANLSGVVTSTGNVTAIADAALSIAKTSGLQSELDLKAPRCFAIAMSVALG